MAEEFTLKFRILYKDENGRFAIKVCDTQEEVAAWMEGHLDSHFIRFKVFNNNGAGLFFDSLEEAKAAAEKYGQPCKPVFPGERYSYEASKLVYGLC